MTEILEIHSNLHNNRIFFIIKIGYSAQQKMTDQCHTFLVKSSWICAIPDRPDVLVSQNTVAHGLNKETTFLLSPDSKFMN